MEFIPLAEERGLIVPIGEWVIRAACAQIQAWRGQGFAPVRVAVNVSARQFRQKNIQKVFASALAESGLDHSCVEVELTESLLQTEQAERILLALKAAGITIAIDDFGTGFSSLSYLKRFQWIYSRSTARLRTEFPSTWITPRFAGLSLPWRTA